MSEIENLQESLLAKYTKLKSQSEQGLPSAQTLSVKEAQFLNQQLIAPSQQFPPQVILPLLAYARALPQHLIAPDALIALFKKTSEEIEQLLILKVFHQHLWPKYLMNSQNIPTAQLDLLDQSLLSDHLETKNFALNILLDLGPAAHQLAREIASDGRQSQYLYFFLHPQKTKRQWNKNFAAWVEKWTQVAALN